MAVSRSLSHLADESLLDALDAIVMRHRGVTAEMLAHIAEVDARKLYLSRGYASMYDYCVRRLRFSEQAAYKRIRAARAARQYPSILEAIADGRLHLSAVVLVAPFLIPGTAGELLAAAFNKTSADVELLLRQRFPRPDVPTRLQALPSLPATRVLKAAGAVAAVEQSAAALAGAAIADETGPDSDQLSSRRVDGRGPNSDQLSSRTVSASSPVVPAAVPSPAARGRVTPLSPQRYALQVTIPQSTRDKLRYLQELLSHRIPSGELAEVLDRICDLAIGQLERQRFAATEKPRPAQPPSTASRLVPAEVKRAVRKRDGGRCTFVSDDGRRCPSRSFLEYEHVEPVARGGRATVAGIRLLCRAHNQHAAERVFGTDFMSRKRDLGRRSSRACAVQTHGSAARARARVSARRP